MAIYEHVWGSEQLDLRLDVEPKKGSHDQEQVLTNGVWGVALIGIKSFARHYPGLYFAFEIYEDVFDIHGEVVEQHYVGLGQLTNWYEANSQA